MLKKISLFALALVVITACSSSDKKEKTKDTKLYVSSFLKNNKNIVAFGNVGVKSILDKTAYQKQGLIGAFIAPEVSKVEKVLNIQAPMYFAAQGPLDRDGAPEKTFLFFNVTNADSLVDHLKNESYEVNTAGKIRFVENGDFVLGVKDDLAIAIVQSGDYDAKKVAKEAFKMSEGDQSGGKIDELLNKKGDIVVNVNIESLYGTSDTDLADLDEAKKKKLQKMVEGSYIHTSFKFEDGAAIIESKNYFSDELKKMMFFKKDASGGIAKKLAKGEGLVIGGLSVNLDVKKLEAFCEEFSPETLEMITKAYGMSGDMDMMSMVAGSGALSQLTDGRLGVMLTGSPQENSASVNMFIGASTMGKTLFTMSKQTAKFPAMDYQYKDDGIYGYSNVYGGGSDAKSMKSLPLPKGCENFGKGGFSAFISFQGVPVADFGFSGPTKMIEVVSYVTVEYNNEGGRIYIKARKGKENVLEQFMNVAVEAFQDEMGGLSMM